MRLFGNLKVKDNEVFLGPYSMSYLRENYKTPLYIVDEDYFRETIGKFRDNFVSDNFETKVLYASKALLNIYTANVVSDEGIAIDAVSGGEIYTISKSNMDAGNIYFHGNNKLVEELELAVKLGVGRIVIDNEAEIDRLEDVVRRFRYSEGDINDGSKKFRDRGALNDETNHNNSPRPFKQKVLLRLNPGIDAHTHEYISTSKNDSKFGLSIFSDDIFDIISRINDSEFLEFLGFHAHIGSQVFREESFFDEAKTMIDFMRKTEDRSIKVRELNLGGGFGIYYTEEDEPFELEGFLRRYVEVCEKYLDENNLEIDTLTIEPGRSMISNCGHTLYTASSTKKTYGGKNFVFIDGSMNDNIRPALYGAKYEACVANRFDNDDEEVYTIAGKCCESGDIIIKDIELPKVEDDDLILVGSTGAYNYSMASNYNRVSRPEMIFVSKDGINVAVRRETYEDIISNDVF